MQLHEWAFALAAWREPHGEPGGEVNASTRVVEESLENIGATVMGRNMFGGRGPWGDEPWDGWWGEDPPFHTPVFVITHHPRPPLVKQWRHDVHVRHGRHRVRTRAGPHRRRRQGRRARRRRERRPAVPAGRADRRDADQPRPGSARRGRAPAATDLGGVDLRPRVRRRGRRSWRHTHHLQDTAVSGQLRRALRSRAGARRRSSPGCAGGRARRPRRQTRGPPRAARTIRCSTPGSSSAHIDWALRTSGSSSASGRRQKASKKPSTQSPGVGMRSTRVRPPSAAATSSIGRKPRPLDREALAQEVLLPRRQPRELEREDHDRSAGDPAQLGQARPGRLPVVDRHARHRRVDGVVVQRQRLGTRRDRRRGAGGALGAHRRARLDGQHPAIARLVGAGPGADVQRPCARRRAPRGCARRYAGRHDGAAHRCDRGGRSRRAASTRLPGRLDRARWS